MGVTVGVADDALPTPYSWNLAMFDCRLGGKLAVEGTGDGVYDRRSATDLAARRFCAVPKPLGESGIPRKPEDC